jgi:signal transduction histidine kinase
MPDGGSISISVGKKGDLAKISVKDTGVGIPEEILPKLFLPLFTTRSKGVGLGLSVCKRMVDAMGGEIAISTRLGEGTEAVIEIPVR